MRTIIITFLYGLIQVAHCVLHWAHNSKRLELVLEAIAQFALTQLLELSVLGLASVVAALSLRHADGYVSYCLSVTHVAFVSIGWLHFMTTAFNIPIPGYLQALCHGPIVDAISIIAFFAVIIEVAIAFYKAIVK